MKSVTWMAASAGVLSLGLFLSSALGENQASFPFVGVIKGNSVYVRSGPDTNYTPLSRLMRNNKVQVVGEEDEWYKIAPPQGSFSWVSKEFTEKKEGTKGVITGDRVAIRAGSYLKDNKNAIQLLASKGMEVTILGEEGNWYKIVPPQGAFVWVSKSFVQSPMPAGKAPAAAAAATTQPAGTAEKPATPEPKATPESPKTSKAPKALAELTTQPAPEQTPAIPGVNKGVIEKRYSYKITTTMPVGEDDTLGKYTKQIEDLDKVFLVEMKKPLPQRNFDKIEPRLKEIAGQTENKAAAQFAKDRLTIIDYQKNAQKGIAGISELQESYEREINSKPLPPMKDTVDTSPDVYRLQGTGILRPSLVFEGALMPKRFRLFDASKCRTIAYVELAPGVQINITQYLSKNVAVYGTASFDAKLGFKLIHADAFKILEEPSRVTNSPDVIQ